ncbi:MAG TPA: beta-ketoacyl synthase N-terminal-like domain-containing protein [Polyangiaceae bacterium]
MESSAVAVIGMAGRFPGAADVRAFWKNLSAGVEAVRHFTDDELRASGEAEESIGDPSYVKACGRLDGIDLFDAAFFGMSPRDAAIFDPQHRVFLECAWEAFEHAGYVGESVIGPVGVFASCGMSDYMIKNVMTNHEVMTNVGEWLVRHTGNDTNFLATRVSYELNLRGPSMNVQTACSSSLVAVHLACQSLLNGECDLALAGGATIYAEQNKGYLWREGDILSSDGHTRSFDANATGTVMSNAVACVVLKRLSDAEHDGDHVLAVVRGSAVNNDGRDKAGYLAPSVSGQARAVTEALAVSGVSAEEVSYVEAHGTGTRIGDPIEIAALTQAFRAHTDKTGYCAIGSLKSSIGHTGEASGAAAFVKAVLAIENGQIPPSLNYESPNPRCALPSSPFFVNTKLRPWEEGRRVAGVTSLGAGGTNCHVILEQAPARPERAASGDPQLLVVSARTAAALETATRNLGRHLEEHPDAPLADVAYTLAVGRKAFRHRRAIVAKDAAEAARAIASRDPRSVFTGQQTTAPRKEPSASGGGLLDEQGHLVVGSGSGSDLASVLAEVGRMWTTGDVTVSALYEGQGRRRVALPTYPWQRQRYWVTPSQRATPTAVATAPTLTLTPAPSLAHLERPSSASPFVAPRTSLERELAAVWRELLGVEHIGVHDDFFDLGGQSLIAVRLFTRIRKKYGIDLPLSTLLEAPCIEKCAAIIAAASPAELEPEASPPLASASAHEVRSLVAIERGDGRTPFYCVHGAGGNVLNFRDLSRALGAEQPFYGLQARGVDGVLRPHETIEEMAAAYVDEVCALQPRGPYLLGGYSGGGLVALEMARRLTESGEAVGLLAFLDTIHPSAPVREMTFSRRLERARGEGLGAYLSRSIGRKLSEQRARRKAEEAERLVARGEPIPAELRDEHLMQSFEKARLRYRPQPWNGRAILFRAEEIDYIYGDVSPAYGWEGVIANITIARVPGNHDNLLLGERAPVLIAALRRAIAQAGTATLDAAE